MANRCPLITHCSASRAWTVFLPNLPHHHAHKSARHKSESIEYWNFLRWCIGILPRSWRKILSTLSIITARFYRMKLHIEEDRSLMFLIMFLDSNYVLVISFHLRGELLEFQSWYSCETFIFDQFISSSSIFCYCSRATFTIWWLSQCEIFHSFFAILQSFMNVCNIVTPTLWFSARQFEIIISR